MGTIVGAYWDSRAESVEQCADRTARLIASLAAIDPLLTDWRETGLAQRAKGWTDRRMRWRSQP